MLQRRFAVPPASMRGCWGFHPVSLLQVAFKLDGDEDDAHLVAWTTTPW